MSNCWRLQSIAPGESRANLLLNGEIDMPENNTPASGAADLPEFPGPPEPQIMMWNALEIVAIRKYGADMFRAGRLAASAPVAPTLETEAVRWEFRWLNPANSPYSSPSEMAWKLVEPKSMQPLEAALSDLWACRYAGKPCYEVRPLFAQAAPVAPAPQPSPTAGMNMVQRILHVGGRNPPGSTYVEFGSIQAVEALVKQVQRDLPRHQCRRLPDHEIVTMYAECPSSDAEMLDFAHELMDAMLAPTLPAEQVATTDDPGPLLDDDGRAMVANSHHYTPEDIRALVKQLRAFSDPQQTTQADWDALDWRGHCNVLWRVMSALADEVVPAPLQQGEYLPQQDSDAPASLGAYLAAWAGGVHSRTKNDTGAAEDWISVPVERLGHAAAALIASRGAAQAAPAPASHEALTTALAACRDAFTVPDPGSAAEFEWQGAMTDPLGVPAYVRACAAPPAQEARVPLSSKECRDILEEVDHYNFAIDLIRAVEKHHGITAAQKETPC